MPALAELQDAFRAAMRGEGDGPVAAMMADGAGLGANIRLDIYRNNIASALVRGLEGIYPALVKLMGTNFFARLARDFVCAHPPRHGRLVEFGFELPGFVADYEPAGGYPWFADVGRLELAWHRAYIAAEAPPLRGEELAKVPPERMADLRFALHPSAGCLASPFPVSTIWRIAIEEEEPDAPITVDGGAERLLVIRPRAEVEVRTFDESGFGFVRALGAGESLGVACAKASARDADFNLEANLRSLIAGETFTGFRLPS